MISYNTSHFNSFSPNSLFSHLSLHIVYYVLKFLFHQFTSAQIQEFKLVTLHKCASITSFFGVISTNSHHHKVEVFIFSYFICFFSPIYLFIIFFLHFSF